MHNFGSKLVFLALILIPYTSKAAGSCLVIFDPLGLGGQAGLFQTSTNFLNDPNCEAIIFYPPIVSLGFYDGDTGIQKIPLTAKSRKELQEYLLVYNFSPDLRFFDYSPSAMKGFLAKLAENEKIYKSMIEFHGSPQSISSYPAQTDKYRKTRLGHVLPKDELSTADLMFMTFSDEKKVNSVKEKLKKLPNGNWANPCAEAYRYYMDPESVKTPDTYSLKAEAANLDKEYTSRLINSCKYYERAKEILKKHESGPRSADLCKLQERYFNNYTQLYSCMINNFEYNYVDSQLLSPHEGGVSLIASCAVGLEEASLLLDPFKYLKGCPEEHKSAKKTLAESRKGNSQKSANRLCKGAKPGVKFTVALDVTYSSPGPSTLMKQVNEDDEDDEDATPFDLTSAENIYNDLQERCEGDLYTAKKSIGEWYRKLRNAEEDISTSTNLKLVTYKAQLEKLSCANSGLLSQNEKEALKLDLLNFHLNAILHSSILVGANYVDFPVDFSGKQEIIRLAKLFESTRQSLEETYKNIKLDSREAQIKAMQRVVYLAEENTKNLGFYDCYKCTGDGIAEKIACDDLKDAFRFESYIGDARDFKDAKNFSNLYRSINDAAENAQVATPPFCRRPIPQCEFGDCKPSAEHKK